MNEQIKISDNSIMRSLLQKAVRRGNVDLVKKIVIYLIKNNDQDWLRKRLAVITFEECWVYALNVNFENKPEFLLTQYINITKSIKNKNAYSLGILAYHFSEGDKSVFWNLNKEEIKHIKYIFHALQRPNDFWKWIINETKNDFEKSKLVNKAFEAVKKASWHWDKSFIISGAYLSVIDNLPELKQSNIIIETPYWVGIDKHTYLGKRAIRIASSQENINENLALWLSFQFEGSVCNEVEESFWTKKEFEWQFYKNQIDLEEAKLLWNSLKIKIENILTEESNIIHNKLNSINEHNFIQNTEQMTIF